MFLRAMLAVSLLVGLGPVAVQAADAARAGFSGTARVVGLIDATRHRLQTVQTRIQVQRGSVATAQARASECKGQAARLEPRPDPESQDVRRPATRMSAYRACLARG
jgi:hypothetical protein